MSNGFTKSPVSNSIPFDKSGQSYNSDNVQEAFQEVRDRVVWPSTTTPTSTSGTLTLVENSFSLQYFTGSATGYSVVLPNATTLFKGRKFELSNLSSTPILIKNSIGGTLITLGQTSIAYATLQDNGTPAGQWVIWQVFVSSLASGILNYTIVSGTPFITTSSSEVQITGFSVIPQAGVYSCWFSTDLQIGSNNRIATTSLYTGGSINSNTTRSVQGVGSNFFAQSSFVGLAEVNGSDTVDIRVSISSGTVTINQRSLILIRLGS